ncbi:MAG TPA: DUF1206 domain-containing protein [Gemmatimonadaceae bacterium]|nr:DUF1206 domain-containing protein [Gemmatimonadaceae bacterium]
MSSSPSIAALARVGFVAKALLYALIGVLAGCAALSARRSGDTTDTRGAIDRLHDMPLGRWLLLGVAVGLAGYAIWRFVEGFADPDRRGADARGLALRSSFVARGVIHAWLAFAAAKAALGRPASSGGGGTKRATATALSLPAGEWLVWACALGIGAYGLYQLYRGLTSRLNRDIDEHFAKAETGPWILVVSRVGIAARGLVFLAIAWLFTRAARSHDPSSAGGLGDALDAIARLGRWPLLLIAAGLIAYGGYQLVSARYRRIPV